MQSGDNAGTSPISEWPPGNWSAADVPSSQSAPLVSGRAPVVRSSGQRGDLQRDHQRGDSLRSDSQQSDSQRSETLPAPSDHVSSEAHNLQANSLPSSGLVAHSLPAHSLAANSLPAISVPAESGIVQGRGGWRDTADDERWAAPEPAVLDAGERGLGAPAIAENAAPTLAPAQGERNVALLAAGLGHDLNNLLVGVLGNAELAQAAYLRGDDPTAHLFAVRAAAERASALATSMVRFASDQHGVTAPFDLSELVGEIVMLARAGVSKSAQVLRAGVGERRGTWPAPDWDADANEVEEVKVPLLVRGDSGRIGQVVLNLIVNGADALGANGGEVHIDVERVDQLPEELVLSPSACALEGYARLRVSDTGSGISRENLLRIFEPFFSTKRQGRGLGLASCLDIIRDHEGGLGVITEVGAGTTFEVYLPLCPEEAPVAIRPDGPASAPEWRTSGRVLVIDDEPMVARLTAMVLEHVGLRPTIGHTGASALELLRQSLTDAESSGYRIVVVDLTMPDLSGQEVLEQIRVLSPGLPVVLTSGFSEQQLRQRGAFAGFDGFLQKPFRMTAMVEVLQGLLEPAPES